jgi:hypothetical protein
MGFKAGPPPCHLTAAAAAADGREKKKKKVDNGEGDEEPPLVSLSTAPSWTTTATGRGGGWSSALGRVGGVCGV